MSFRRSQRRQPHRGRRHRHAIYPVLQVWAQKYQQQTGDEVNYQAIGSGGGIKQIESKTVDFANSDKPLMHDEITQNHLVQFPQVVISIVPVVHLQGVAAGQMVLDGMTLSKIFLGQITKWDDAAIKKLNPKVNLPDTAILTVHRSDGSGTTFNFTNYLGKVNPEWQSKVGADTAVSWPGGIGGKGNAGVAASVQQTKGSIGYVEYAYAKQSNLVWTDHGEWRRQAGRSHHGSVPGRGRQRRLHQGAGFLRNPHQPARRRKLANHCRHLHVAA